jgi:DNA-binding transcriptional LysR family regulator
MPLIFFEKKDPLFYYWCRQRFNNVPKGVKPRLVLNSFGQILHAVSLGLGIAVVPTHVLNRSAFKDKVETLGKEYIVHNNSFHFIFHAEFKDSLKLKTFFEFLHLEAKTLDI